MDNQYTKLRKRTPSKQKRYMTQAEWAVALGVDPRTVRSWEQDEYQPLPETLTKMKGLAR